MKRSGRRGFGFLPVPFRVLAAFALALIVSEHALPALHHVLVVHELCPEHGKLEHVGAEARELSHAASGAVSVTSSGEQGEHEHCGTVPASPPRAPLVDAFAGPLAHAPGALAPSALVSAAVPPADVVAFAPKQSPPA